MQASNHSSLHRKKEWKVRKELSELCPRAQKWRHGCLLCTANLVDLKYNMHRGSNVHVFQTNIISDGKYIEKSRHSATQFHLSRLSPDCQLIEVQRPNWA